MALEGTNAVLAARGTIGETNPAKATAGSIRGDLGLEIGRNLVHGSDSPENGEAEIALWVKPDELVRATGRTAPRTFEKPQLQYLITSHERARWRPTTN